MKWSDGKDVTADDVIFSYEVIGHKDYTGIRYDDNFTNIVGMEDYHDGKSPTISGIEKVNDKEVKITYKRSSPRNATIRWRCLGLSFTKTCL